MDDVTKDKVFVDGMIFKKPRENAPSFVKGHVAVKVEALTTFLQTHRKPDGWVNIDLKQSREGKLYLELDTYVKPVDDFSVTAPVAESQTASLEASAAVAVG